MSYAPGDTVRIPVTGDTLTVLDGTTSPYGLYRNGSRDAAVTVTVTGAGGDWLATLTIPSGYSLGDVLWLKLLATTADGTYVIASEPIVLADVQAAAAAAIAAAEPIDANVTQVAGVSFAEGVRDALGMADADMDDQLDAILVQATAAAEASGGTGARTCVITVNDGTDPLESARVRVTKGAESWLQTTGASGQATFNLDDGSWTVAITLAGYTFSGDTLVVDGDETETYSMTAAGFTPSVEPDSLTVRWRVMNEDGRPCGAGEGTVRIRVSVGPNVAGFAWDKSERIATTDANGYVEFPDVPAGCTLRAKLGAASAGGEWIDVAIPIDATSPYEPVEILGTVP